MQQQREELKTHWKLRAHLLCTFARTHKEMKSGKKARYKNRGEEKKITSNTWYLHIWFMEYLSRSNRNRWGAWFCFLFPSSYTIQWTMLLHGAYWNHCVVANDWNRRKKIKLSSSSWWYSKYGILTTYIFIDLLDPKHTHTEKKILIEPFCRKYLFK